MLSLVIGDFSTPITKCPPIRSFATDSNTFYFSYEILPRESGTRESGSWLTGVLPTTHSHQDNQLNVFEVALQTKNVYRKFCHSLVLGFSLK